MLWISKDKGWEHIHLWENEPELNKDGEFECSAKDYIYYWDDINGLLDENNKGLLERLGLELGAGEKKQVTLTEISDG